MIKKAIKINYIHQYNLIQNFADNLYIVDYSDSTKNLAVKKGIVFYSPSRPQTIDSFEIINPKKLSLDCIPFDQNSFKHSNGKTKSQCEAVIIPEITSQDSWILFSELKYSSNENFNIKNISKALKQLFKTQYYYKQDKIISNTNPCYLLVSLPFQTEPFANFTITQADLINLKRKRNITLRLKNSVEILDNKIILV